MDKNEAINSCPVFPLSINVLPGAYLPLQIFEPRYLDMVKTSLAKEEGFCIALTKNEDPISVFNFPFSYLFSFKSFIEHLFDKKKTIKKPINKKKIFSLF